MVAIGPVYLDKLMISFCVVIHVNQKMYSLFVGHCTVPSQKSEDKFGHVFHHTNPNNSISRTTGPIAMKLWDYIQLYHS